MVYIPVSDGAKTLSPDMLSSCRGTALPKGYLLHPTLLTSSPHASAQSSSIAPGAHRKLPHVNTNVLISASIPPVAQTHSRESLLTLSRPKVRTYSFQSNLTTISNIWIDMVSLNGAVDISCECGRPHRVMP